MLIAGASGHAAELYEVLLANGYDREVVFYDDVSASLVQGPNAVRIVRSREEAADYFRSQPDFALGIGHPRARKLLAEKLAKAGGQLTSVVSSDAFIGKQDIVLGDGLNIMPYATVTTKTSIGTGTLVHIHVSIHHDTQIGCYCELSPGSRILGGAKLGDLVSVGTNAVVMRNIIVGDGAVIGAGAVVTKNVAPGSVVKGVPAR